MILCDGAIRLFGDHVTAAGDGRRAGGAVADNNPEMGDYFRTRV